MEQNPIVRRDLAVEVRAAPLVAGHGESYRLATSKKAQRRPAQGQSQNNKTHNDGDLTTKT
jgi:hypothetical protein